eukprot:3758252-Rhodomonas_salina.1
MARDGSTWRKEGGMREDGSTESSEIPDPSSPAPHPAQAIPDGLHPVRVIPGAQDTHETKPSVTRHPRLLGGV